MHIWNQLKNFSFQLPASWWLCVPESRSFHIAVSSDLNVSAPVWYSSLPFMCLWHACNLACFWPQTLLETWLSSPFLIFTPQGVFAYFMTPAVRLESHCKAGNRTQPRLFTVASNSKPYHPYCTWCLFPPLCLPVAPSCSLFSGPLQVGSPPNTYSVNGCSSVS